MTKHDKDTHPKHALKKIMDRGLTSPARLVLCALWIHSDKLGESYPSIDLLSKETLLNKRTIYRCISELREGGVIAVRENLKGKTNLYKFLSKKSNGDTQSPHSDTVSPYDDTQSPIKGDTQSLGCDTQSPDGCHSVTGRVTHSRCIYNEEHPNELPSEHPNEIRGKEKRKKETPYWEQKTFEEVLEEVKDRPYLERMAYAVKAHPMVRDLYKDSFITAIDSIGYDIMDDFKAEAERRERAGEPLNDWHRGVLSGDWRYKDIILGHYQHMQNAEKHLFGEPIDPEAYREFGHYYDRVFPKFEKQIKDLFLDLPVRKKDPQWKDYFNRHGDGPWTYRKYTRS